MNKLFCVHFNKILPFLQPFTTLTWFLQRINFNLELGGNSYPLEDTFRVADPNGIYIFYRSGACLNLSFAVHQRISHIMQERFADLTCIYSVCINWPLILKVKGSSPFFIKKELKMSITITCSPCRIYDLIFILDFRIG